MKKILVVGAGISGATIANKIATELGNKVVIIDKSSHIAGNCYDELQCDIRVHKFGAHIFHTSNKDVYDFLSKFTEFNDYQHKVKALVQNKQIPIPFNFNSIDILFDEEKAKLIKEKLVQNYEMDSKVPILELRNNKDRDLQELAKFIYEHIFLHYTLKQWGLKPDEIDKSVSGRVPVYIGRDNRYFPWDKYQGIPNVGYTNMISNMLNHDNIELRLDTEFEDINIDEFDHVFYTGTIDGFFNYKFGSLPYRSERFDNKALQQEFFQDISVINYPDQKNQFTRIIEHKHFLNDKSDKTIVSYEYPEAYEDGKNDPYYPINKPKNIELYEKYLSESKKIENITFLGRLGDYKYYDMDKAVQRALEIFNLFKGE